MRSLASIQALVVSGLIGYSAAPARATVDASCWSYEVGDARSHPVSASAGITRSGTPGSSAANVTANNAALQSVVTMTGCGVGAGFQQPCNACNSHAAFNDMLKVTANAPNGTAVQVRSTLRFAGSIHGTGVYNYNFSAHLNGVGNGWTGSTGGTVQVVNNLNLDRTFQWTQNLLVGTNYPLSGLFDSSVGNRWCAGGSNTCTASQTEWTMTLTGGLTLQLEVLTPGLDAQVLGAGGYNYLAQPVSVGASAPSHASLAQSGPNPSRGEVDLSLTLGEPTPMDVGVFDLSGRRVATLARGELRAGLTALRWDGRGTDGRTLRGMFFVRARGEGVDLKRQVVLVR